MRLTFKKENLFFILFHVPPFLMKKLQTHTVNELLIIKFKKIYNIARNVNFVWVRKYKDVVG